MAVVLLTNDDGLDAPGLSALEQVLLEADGVELWTVAPDGERSASSHGMTLHSPLNVKEVAKRRFAVSGTVADCVYLAMFGLMKTRPDVVISGVNAGPNLGSDVIYSGTVAGAREAAVRGVHGVASSLVAGDDFAGAARATVDVARQMAKLPCDSPLVLNLNFPAGEFKAPTLGPLGRRIYPEQVEQRSAPVSKKHYYWLGGPPVQDREDPGTDGWLVARGRASATYLKLDQTDIRSTNVSPVSCLLQASAPESK